jgi:lipopolysaccharide biosynthesis regulator YciM
MNNNRYLLPSVLILTLIFSATGLMAIERNTLTNIYHRDYGIVNRTVIVFTGEPNYSIEQRVTQRQIRLLLEDTVAGSNLSQSQTFFSPVLESLNISQKAGEVILTINTSRRYHLKHFDLSGREFKIVLDIFNKESPETVYEKFAFARFYLTIGQTVEAERLMREILTTSPQVSEANYYLGQILLQRGDTQEAVRRFASVQYVASEYIPAQLELMKLGQLDVEYSQEIEQAFSNLRNYFLYAGDLNRQYFLLALAASVYGNADEVKTILAKIDDEGKTLQTMVRNVSSVFHEVSSENKLPQVFTVLQDYVPPRKVTPADVMWLLAFIIATALIVYIITFSVVRSKYQKSALTPRTKAPPRVFDPRERFSKTYEAKKQHEKKAEQKRKAEEPVEENEVSDDKPKIKKAANAKKTTVSKKPEAAERKTERTKLPAKKKQPEKSTDNEDMNSKLALKLYNDGWNIEAIAKELKLDVAIIEKIIAAPDKTNKENE